LIARQSEEEKEIVVEVTVMTRKASARMIFPI
jgi:hypothetical protein